MTTPCIHVSVLTGCDNSWNYQMVARNCVKTHSEESKNSPLFSLDLLICKQHAQKYNLSHFVYLLLWIYYFWISYCNNRNCCQLNGFTWEFSNIQLPRFSPTLLIHHILLSLAHTKIHFNYFLLCIFLVTPLIQLFITSLLYCSDSSKTGLPTSTSHSCEASTSVLLRCSSKEKIPFKFLLWSKHFKYFPWTRV